jgi:hypothetical protein
MHFSNLVLVLLLHQLALLRQRKEKNSDRLQTGDACKFRQIGLNL